MSKLQICISVYKKSYSELYRLIKSIPTNIDIRIDIDGGWDINWSNEEFTSITSMSNVNIIQHYFNKGLAKIRNIQLKECNHEFIQWVDADDYLTGDSGIENATYKIDMIVSPVNLISNGKSFIEYRNCNVANGNGQTYFVIPSIIFRTKFLKSNNLTFDESGVIFEDIIFSAKLSNIPAKVIINSNPYYNYISSTEGSLSHPKDKSKIINSTLYFIKELYKLPRTSVTYTRIVEECLRILQLDELSDKLRLEVVDYMKPYKYFKS